MVPFSQNILNLRTLQTCFLSFIRTRAQPSQVNEELPTDTGARGSKALTSTKRLSPSGQTATVPSMRDYS